MLERLISEFSDLDTVPVEIEEIRQKILDMGVQEKIVLCEVPMEPGELRGVFHQYTESRGPYTEPDRVCLIVYPENMPLAWQRIICAKELIHIFDPDALRTRTSDDVYALAERLVGPLETDDFDIARIAALGDQLAQFQALRLLVPEAARLKARSRLRSGSITLEQIAEQLVIPETFVSLVMDDRWISLVDDITEIANAHMVA